MDSRTILWVTTVIMTAGGLAILFMGKHRTRAEYLSTVCHGIVPLIAACSYFAMATGQGAISLIPVSPAAEAVVGAGRVFYFARYVDWMFTTPLLLFSLCTLAMRNGQKVAGAFLGVILADLMMIVTALLFGLSEVPVLKWAWFFISCAAFLGVYYVLWVTNREANLLEREDVQSSYSRNNVFLSIVWLIYPLALAISPDGLRLISDAGGILFIAVLDVIAKVVYGLMATASDGRMTERDLTEGTVSTPTKMRAVA